jgi:hypothetical protein
MDILKGDPDQDSYHYAEEVIIYWLPGGIMPGILAY